MADSLQSFVDKVRQTYSRVINPSILKATNTNARTGAPVDTSGVRGTGLGLDNKLQKNKVAGEVHEGEQVVEADMVRKAGGPRKIRGAVENLARTNGKQPANVQQPANGQEPPVPFQQAPVDESPVNGSALKGRGLPGFARGTGSSVVPNVPTVRPTITSPANTPPILPPEDTADEVPATSDTPALVGDAPGEETGTEDVATAGVDTSGDFGADAADIIGTSAEGLKDVAAGTDENFKKLADITRMNLAGRQSADVLKQSQAIAQAQKTGGEAAAAKARLQQQQGIETSEAEAALFKEDVSRRDNALSQLSALGINVAGLEEQRAGRLSNEDYRDKVFNDDIFRWEKQYNLDLSSFSWAKEKWGEEFDLEKDKFGLDEDKFEEFKSQFNETHSLDLARFELDELQFEEFKSQFDDQMELNWSQFEQDKTEFGLDYALRAMTYNFETNTILAEAAIAAEDFETASEYYGLAGMKATTTTVYDANGNPVTTVDFDPAVHGIDFTRLEDAATRVEFDEALSGVRDSILNMGDGVHDIDTYGDIEGDSPLMNSLEDMYEAGTGKAPSGADFENWAMNQLDGIRLSQDPYHSAISGLDDSTIEAIIEGRGLGDDVNAFEFGNATGIEAGRRALVSIMAGGGMTITEDGITYNTDSPAWSVFAPPAINTKDLSDVSGGGDPASGWNNEGNETFVTVGDETFKQGEQFVQNGKVYEVVPVSKVGDDGNYWKQVGVASTTSTPAGDLDFSGDTEDSKVNIRLFGRDGSSAADFDNLQPDDWATLNPDQKQKFYSSNDFHDITEDGGTFVQAKETTYEDGSLTPEFRMAQDNSWAKPGTYVEVGGVLYKVQDPPTVRHDNSAGWYQDTQYKVHINLLNTETNQPSPDTLASGWFD